jgi:asparagine N-glycosylation enzyme membrane subunit Stt3
VTARPGGRFQDPDAAFHARRVERAIRASAILPPVFDAFENFPEGGRAVWPPLHDAALGLAARLGGSTPAEPGRGMTAAALVPVLELVLALLAAAALAAETGGALGAAVAAVLFALMPTAVVRGGFGEIDHNMTEILGALVLLLVARAATSARAAKSARTLALASLAWAAGVLLALGFHTGLLLSAGVMAAAALAAETYAGEGSGAPLAMGFALASAALPFFAGLRVKPEPGDPWRLGPVYALALSIGAIGCAGVSLWRRRTPLSLGAGIVALAVLALLPRAAWGGLLRGLGFLGAREAWLSSIQEFQPVWTNPEVVRGALPGLLAATVSLVAAFAARPPRVPRARLLVVSLPFAAFLLLGVLQQRFLPLASALAAAAAGAAFGLVGRRVRLAIAAAGLAGLVTAGPMIARTLRGTFRAEADTSLSAPEVVAAVLKERTPDPGDPPAWGVLAPWDYGHPILFGAGRAVALDNFGSWHPGFEEKMRLFAETSPRRAVEALAAKRLRYVVAPFAPPVLFGLANALGRRPADWLLVDAPASLYRGTPEGERTLLFRLHRGDAAPFPGEDAADVAALRRFRKIWESPEGAPGTGPYLKIFELTGEESSR